MYAIYGNIYHQYTPNVSIYTIHGSYGYVYICMFCRSSCFYFFLGGWEWIKVAWIELIKIVKSKQVILPSPEHSPNKPIPLILPSGYVKIAIENC